jgi:predicted TIM-barrel enzyme
MQFTRKDVLARLRKALREGHPIIAAGAGIGLSAKFAERGGADLIIIYNSGRYRMTGYSSLCGYLPIGDANGIVKEMGEREVLPVTRDTPVIAGVFAADPTREISHFLQELMGLGFSGVINLPSIAWLEGELRAGLEASGLGFRREVDMIRAAGEAGLFTLAYVFTTQEATAMTQAGVDVVVAHMGDTIGGSVGQPQAIALEARRPSPRRSPTRRARKSPTSSRFVMAARSRSQRTSLSFSRKRTSRVRGRLQHGASAGGVGDRGDDQSLQRTGAAFARRVERGVAGPRMTRAARVSEGGEAASPC